MLFVSVHYISVLFCRSCGLGSYTMSRMNTGGYWEAASMQTWNQGELKSGLSEAPWHTRP